MLVTLSGIIILVKPLQYLKAESPMLVTLSGIVTLVSPLQPEKAELPMLVTLPSEGIMLLSQPRIRLLLFVSIRQFPAL